MPFFVLFLLLLSPLAKGQDDIDFAALEEALLKEFSEAKPDVDRQALVFQIVAQEFALYQNFPKSYEYHQKVIALKTNEDKTPSYIELIWLSDRLKQSSEIPKWIKELEDYLTKNPERKSTELQTYLEFLKKKIEGKWTAKDFSHPYYGITARQDTFRKYLKQKRYSEALALINANHLKDAGVLAQIRYDLLSVLVRKKNVNKLLCEENFKKYSNAYSYSVKICGILLDYLHDGGQQTLLIQDLDQYFKNQHQDQAYLLDLIKDLGVSQ